MSNRTTVSHRTKRLCWIAMLAALSFLLNMVQLRLPMNLRITFDSLPVVVGALLFGPVDAALAALAGEFFTQMLSEYGLTATTMLWLIPPAVRGLVIGAAAWKFRNTDRPLEARVPLCFAVCFLAAVLTTLGNTAVIWLDSVINHYYTFALVFGSALVRLTASLLTSAAITAAAIPLVSRLRQSGRLPA